MISAHQLKIVFCIYGLMGVQVSLRLHMNVPRCMIDEETTTRKHFRISCFASGSKEATVGATHEVVYGNSLTRKEVVLFQDALVVSHN